MILRGFLGKIRRATFRTNHAFWFAKDLKSDENANLSEHDELTVEFHNFEEVVGWLKKEAVQFPWIYNKQEIDSALRNSHLYPAIKYNGETVGYVKVALNKVYIEDYEDEIPLERDECYIYDTFILPEFRMKHFTIKFLKQVLAFLKKIGIYFVYCHIPHWNKASLKLYRNLGFRKIAHIRYVRIFKMRIFSNDPVKVKRMYRHQG
jgi:ribosomal protein S18 acetylase RimI-like enzyme